MALFGWQCEPFGPDYIAFHGAGLAGGFYRDDLCSRSLSGGALIVFYSTDLDASLSLVTSHGGVIVKPVLLFPAGVVSTPPSRREMNLPSGLMADLSWLWP